MDRWIDEYIHKKINEEKWRRERQRQTQREGEKRRDKDGWINRIIYLSASVEKCRNVQGIIPDSF